MENFIKSYWKTVLFFVLAGLIGGFLVGLFLMESYPAEVQQQIYDQGINDVLLGVITAVQSAGYGLLLGGIGIFLSKKIGLWKDEICIAKKPLIISGRIQLPGEVLLFRFLELDV